MIFLLLLLLPSQLALHFWPSWSLINGIRIDYLSPTLYFTDLIIIGLFLISRLRVRVPLPVIIFVVLNILVSSSPLVSLYKWFRVLEFFWLFKYLSLNINFSRSASSSSMFQISNLKFAILWTAVLAWWQFFLQHSVGGLWTWLGERPLSVATPLIAKVSFLGQQLMRPYATFPHPNALAGFLLVTALLLYRRIPWAAALALLTIPITFSRTAIVLEVIFLLIYLRPAILKVALLVSSIYYLVSVSGSVASLPDRLSLIHNSLFIIQKSPLLGVGLGNFLPTTGLYQPVHNLYFLLASELGLPAFLAICYFVFRNCLGFRNSKLVIPVLVILITGLADHYWLTLHQNTLLLVILIAYAYSHRWGSQR
ncbi:MAG: hypothetical protein UX92_C0014G0021 [Candidatus Amesbacteria bacterium GW2011_GWA1_47_20]|uniref:O-antigen ligase-related domain-containing protein n=2 Tax=Candidatus Amesiibacteriota TaxID=1752730 RepID=A0A0G1VGK1_9BACT|nr:MAG: hypothetical protein UX42_C0003G0046 [Microgenomates group bacterium GW2011_GWC1_46_20]KKU69130.1 MAG: hypothetical protein UX92_C0014G0021 [Candidatus Amesbacteria bacterium GW2011_GWA1_47_20]KKU83807.1 MAG: hypothetical protein UY11_C0013G0005 [Candidatus Amesbacteria bacterium GW2011_GWC2_47_8]